MKHREQQKFESKDVSFDLTAINLKRNNFTYETIGYDKVKEIRIFEGYLLKNRLLVVLGALSIIWLGYSVLNTGYSMLKGEELSTYDWLNQFLNRATIISIWGPILLIFGGILALYSAFIKSHIAFIKTDIKTYHLRIKEIEKKCEINMLVDFLKEKKIKIYNEST